MGAYVKVGNMSRGTALLLVVVFLIGTAVGSILPEFGNILARKAGVWAHYFNIYFLIIGIIGVVLALYLGYRCYR